MKKNYQKPTINNVYILKKPHLLVGSHGCDHLCVNDKCTEDQSGTPICTYDTGCPDEEAL